MLLICIDHLARPLTPHTQQPLPHHAQVVDPGLTGDAAIVSRWSSEDVGIWLVSMGLSRFQAQFRFISGIHLLTMDTSAIRALGIADEDDRAELLAAIGSLRASGSAPPLPPGTMVRGFAEHPSDWDPLTNRWSEPWSRPKQQQTGSRRQRFAVQPWAGVDRTIDPACRPADNRRHRSVVHDNRWHHRFAVQLRAGRVLQVRVYDLTTRNVVLQPQDFTVNEARDIIRNGLQSGAAKAILFRRLSDRYRSRKPPVKLSYDPADIAQNYENTGFSGWDVEEPSTPQVESDHEFDTEEQQQPPPRGAINGRSKTDLVRHVHQHYHHQVGGGGDHHQVPSGSGESGGGSGSDAHETTASVASEAPEASLAAEVALSHARQKTMAAWIKKHRYGEDLSPDALFDKMFQSGGPARTQSPMVNGQRVAAVTAARKRVGRAHEQQGGHIRRDRVHTQPRSLADHDLRPKRDPRLGGTGRPSPAAPAPGYDVPSSSGHSGRASSTPARQPRDFDYRSRAIDLDRLWPEGSIPQGGMGNGGNPPELEQQDFSDHNRGTPTTSGPDHYFENMDPMGEANMTQ